MDGVALERRVNESWEASKFSTPYIPLIHVNNAVMAIIDDAGSYVRFMDTPGNIYVVLRKQCTVVKNKLSHNYNYILNSPVATMCNPYNGPGNRDIFVKNVIVPLLIAV